MRKKKNGFTLIELIAVLVILAVIALIVTPLVMNIVNKAKNSANKRSVDGYGRAVELSIASYLLDFKTYPTDLKNLTVEYTGNEVKCNIMTLNEDGSIYLSECSVGGVDVKDTSTDDGYYHYGKLKELSAPTKLIYSIGDTVTYNGINFYVIEASDEDSDRLTLLKATPLTVDEINKYGIDANGVNHINKYPSSSSISGLADNINNTGYGGMSYYTSDTCRYVTSGNGYYTYEGCTTDFSQSDVKYVVDAWSEDNLDQNDLTLDSLGYKVRLLTTDELINNLGYGIEQGVLNGISYKHIAYNSEVSPSWMRIEGYNYWTMSIHEDTNSMLWLISPNNVVDGRVVYAQGVRPVITILKSAI